MAGYRAAFPVHDILNTLPRRISALLFTLSSSFPVTPSCFSPLCHDSAGLIGIACLHLHLHPSSNTRSDSCLQLHAACLLLLSERLLSYRDCPKRDRLDVAVVLLGKGFSSQVAQVWLTYNHLYP